jgi:hypothetical protein
MAEPYAGTASSRPWHSLTAHEFFARLRSSARGLAAQDAEELLRRRGPNRLPPSPRRRPPVQVLLQFQNVFIYESRW